MDVNILYGIRNVALCLGFLAGIGAGVFLLTRKRTLAGALGIAGFALFAFEPLTDFLIFRILYTNLDYDEQLFNTLDMVYPCISGLAIFLGSIALIVALINLARENQSTAIKQVQAEQQDLL